MKIVLFIFISLIFIIFVVLLPIKAQAKFVLDIESKSVYFVVLGAGLSLVKGKVYLLENFTTSVITDKIFFMNMKQSNIEKYFILKALLKKIKIGEVVLLTDAGVQDDAFLTSMIVGSVNAFFASLAPLTRYKKIKYNVKVEPMYKDTNLNVAGETTIKITIFNLIKAIITSKVKTKNYEKEKRYV